MSWLRGPDESGEFGENGRFSKNGKTGEISPTFLMKLECFMQMSWLRGPADESGGFDENGSFGETGETGETFAKVFDEIGRFYANELTLKAHPRPTSFPERRWERG